MITTSSVNSGIDTNNYDMTILANISGVGAIVKKGEGKLTLSGINSYSGGTVVSEGILSLNGQIEGGVRVNSGSTLIGTGTIFGGGEIFGDLSPGNSIGTITFDTSGGNVSLESSSKTNIEIDPTDRSKIAIVGGGHIALGGSLNVLQQEGVYSLDHQYPIIEGAYTGAFNSTVLGGLPGYSFNLLYDPDFVYLIFENSVPYLIPTNNLSGNNSIIASFLNENGSSSTLAFFENLNESQLQSALMRVSPSRNSLGSYTTQQTAFSLSGIVVNHIDGLEKSSSEEDFLATLFADASKNLKPPTNKTKCKDKISGWVLGFGEYAYQKGQNQNPSFHYSSEAVLTGLDYEGKDKNVGRVALGYAHTHLYEDQDFGSASINYYFASFYGKVFKDRFYFSPALWGFFDKNQNTRAIFFPGFSKTAKADIFSWQLLLYLELGYEGEFSWGNIISFSSLDWAITWQRRYQEKGADPFNSIIEAKTSSMMRSETGLKFCEKWEFSSGAFLLKEKASYVFQKPFSTSSKNINFLGTPGGFTLASINQNLNLGAIGVDFLIAMGKKKVVTIDLGYEGEFGANYWTNQILLRIGRIF